MMDLKKEFIVSLMAMMISAMPLQSQDLKTYNVAIVVHDGVELFDFAGPGEVFAAGRYFSEVVDFNVFTVAPKKEAVTSQTFLSVNPTYSIEDAPHIDLLIVPGGQTGVLLKDEAFMSWVGERFADTDNLLTVCTGAFVAAKLGLLDGLKATTHHGSIDNLENNYPEIKVLRETKFIDNGKIITSGGVSSGTEGALHLVHRLAGLDAAKALARYMEYDHWTPELGLIAYENEALQQLKEAVNTINTGDVRADNAFAEALANLSQSDINYGELEAYGLQLKAEQRLEASIRVFERLTTLYPRALATYENLGELYREQGKETPMTQEEFKDYIVANGVEAANTLFDQWMVEYPNWMVFTHHAANSYGYQLLREEKYDDAIGIFELNARAYPEHWNSWDSLADGYRQAGDREKAIAHYEKSLKLNADNQNARDMIEQMKSEMAEME